MSRSVLLTIQRAGETSSQRMSCDKATIRLGRLKSSTVFLDDDAVSCMHAVIEVSAREMRVIDLGGPTGTKVNGEPIHIDKALADGDVVSIGPFDITVNPKDIEARLGSVGQQEPLAPSPTTPEERSVILIKKHGAGDFRVTVDGNNVIKAAAAPSQGLALLRLAAIVGLGEFSANTKAEGVSDSASLLILMMALKSMIESLDAQSQKLPDRLSALLEVRGLIKAERILLAETRSAVLAALSGFKFIRPLTEEQRLERELDDAAKGSP